jgi:hypothetical protein
MTLTQELKSNPYFKPSNCTDLSDLDHAIGEVLKLEDKYGQHKSIDNVFEKLYNKRKKLQE